MCLQIALRTDKDFNSVKKFVEERGFSGFAVREVADQNEHWHWYLEGDRFKSINSFRTTLTKTVPALKGNGGYSAKLCDNDVEKYWRYMCKGESDGAGAEIAWKHGLLWTDARLEELHQSFWANAPNAKRRKLAPIADVVFERCKAKQVAWDDRRTIFEEYIRELYARDKPINLFSVKSSVNLLQIKLAPTVDDGVQQLLNQVALI